MSDGSEKAASAWPQPPAPQGRCHVRVLVQDSRGRTREVGIACADWDTATRVQELIRELASPLDAEPSATQQNPPTPTNALHGERG